MSLSISSRPTKTVGGVVSLFNSVHRPIQYVFNSDLFPTNTSDTEYEVSSVASNALGITVTTTLAHGQVAKEYVTLKNMSVAAYNGNYKILSVPTTTTMVLGATYTATATGELIKYYNNYHAKIRIYAGLPPYHASESSKSLRLIDTIDVIPDASGDVKINVAPLLKQDIEHNYESSVLQPDYNQLTACYISYAESYDAVSGGEVVTNTTAYTDDEVTGCTASGEEVTNGTFTGSYSSWALNENILSLIGRTKDADWLYNSNNVQVTLDSYFSISSELSQAIDFSPFRHYNYSFSLTQSGSEAFIFYLALYDTSRDDYQIIGSTSATGTITSSFIPNNTYDEIHIYMINLGSGTDTWTLDTVSIQSSDCKFYIWAVNAITEFNDANAGNLADYNQNLVNQEPSLSSSPILFPNKFFYESFLIPNATLESAEASGAIKFRLKEYNQSGALLNEKDINLTNLSDGIYHRRLDNQLVSSVSTKGTIQLIELPSNLIKVANGGDFESTFGSFSGSFSGLSWPGSHGVSSSVAQKGSQSLALFDANISLSASNDIMYLNQNISMQANSDYEVSIYVYIPVDVTIRDVAPADANPNISIRLYDDNGNATITQVQYLNITNITTFAQEPSLLTMITNGGDAYTAGSWVQLKATFSNNTASAINCKPGVQMTCGGSSYGWTSSTALTYALFLDNFTFEGPFIPISTKRTFQINRDCTEQDYHIIWLNPLGGYDSYNFSARKDNSVELSGEEIYRNPENNWETGFTSNKFAHDFISVKGRRSYRVRSKPLTTSEVDAIEPVIYSYKAYHVDANDNVKGINIEKNSYTKYTDKDKLTILSFTVKETDFIAIQSQ